MVRLLCCMASFLTVCFYTVKGQACPAGTDAVHVCQAGSKQGPSIHVDGSTARDFHGQCVCEVHAVGGPVVVKLSAPVVPSAPCGSLIYSTEIGFTAHCGNTVQTVSGSIGTEQNAYLTIATETDNANPDYCVKVEKESGEGQVKVACKEILHVDRANQTTKPPTTTSSGSDTTSSTGVDTTSSSGAATTSSSGAATTTSSGGETTSSSGAATTSSSGGETTSSSGAATTSSSGGETTSSSGAATTSSSGAATTTSSGGETTSSSGAATTSSSGAATTSSSGAATTSSSGGETTSSSGGDTTSSSGGETSSSSAGATTSSQACPAGTDAVHVCQAGSKQGPSIHVDGSTARDFHGQCVCEVHAVGGPVVVKLSAPVVPSAPCGSLIYSTEIGFTAHCGNTVQTVSGSIGTEQNAYLTIATETDSANPNYCVKVEKESGEGQVKVSCTEIQHADRANKPPKPPTTTSSGCDTTSSSGVDTTSKSPILRQACPGEGTKVVHVCQAGSKQGPSIHVDGSTARDFHGQCVCEVHAVGWPVVVKLSALVVPSAQCGSLIYSTEIGFTAHCGNTAQTVSGSIGTEQNAYLTIATETDSANPDYCVKVEKESGEGQVKVVCTEIQHADRANKPPKPPTTTSSGCDTTSSSGVDTTSSSGVDTTFSSRVDTTSSSGAATISISGVVCVCVCVCVYF